jgi:hypothetical protein
MNFKDFLSTFDTYLEYENLFSSHYYGYVKNVFVEKKLLYPILIYHTDAMNHTILDNSIAVLKFNFFVFDKLKTDNSNIIDVQDDLLKKLVKIQSYLKRKFFATNFNITAISDEAYSEKITGWVMDCLIKLDTSSDVCIDKPGFVEDYAKVIKRYSDIDLWLRADYGVVTDSNNKVSRWEDFVHPDYNIIQNVADRRPLLVDNYANTFPALKFDGVDDYLNGGDICDLKLTGGTLITVLQHEYLTSVNHFAISKANKDNTDKSWYIRMTAGAWKYRIGFAVVKGSEITYSWFGDYQTSDYKLENVVTAWKIDNANNVIKKYQNGVNTDTNAFDGTYDMNNNYDLVIGAMGRTGLDPLRFWKGHIMEIIKFDRVLTDDEFAYVHEYLNLKYNLY